MIITHTMRAATATGPMPIPSLELFLSYHIKALHDIVADLAPEADIHPMFWFVKPDGSHHVLLPTYENKDADVATFMAVMRQEEAVQYAIISSAWAAEFSGPDAMKDYAIWERDGWTPETTKYRFEVAEVIAGDKTKTLSRLYRMKRSTTGVTLERPEKFGEAFESLNGSAQMGRMIDLLIDRKGFH